MPMARHAEPLALRRQSAPTPRRSGIRGGTGHSLYGRSLRPTRPWRRPPQKPLHGPLLAAIGKERGTTAQQVFRSFGERSAPVDFAMNLRFVLLYALAADFLIRRLLLRPLASLPAGLGGLLGPTVVRRVSSRHFGLSPAAIAKLSLISRISEKTAPFTHIPWVPALSPSVALIAPQPAGLVFLLIICVGITVGSLFFAWSRAKLTGSPGYACLSHPEMLLLLLSRNAWRWARHRVRDATRCRRSRRRPATDG